VRSPNADPTRSDTQDLVQPPWSSRAPACHRTAQIHDRRRRRPFPALSATSLPVNALAVAVAAGHRHRSPPCRSFAPSERMFQVRSARPSPLLPLRSSSSASDRIGGSRAVAFIASVETKPHRPPRDRNIGCRKKPGRFSGSGGRPFSLPPEIAWHWQQPRQVPWFSQPEP